MTTTGAGRIRPRPLFLALALCVLLFCAGVHASIGDRLPEFRQCVEVCDDPGGEGHPSFLPNETVNKTEADHTLQVCKQENCNPNKPQTPIRETSPPLPILGPTTDKTSRLANLTRPLPQLSSTASSSGTAPRSATTPAST